MPGVAGTVVREGLTGEVAFEQNPEGGREGAPLHRKLGEEHSRQKEQQVQRPRGRNVLVCSRKGK